MNQRGFTLIETMVALAVFSVAAMGLVSVTTQSVRIGGELESRFLARAVAENVAVDSATGPVEGQPPVTSGEDVQRRRTFTWVRRIDATPRPGLYSVRIEVTETGSPFVLARLSILTAGSDET